jgi:hypothetical protein
MTRAPHLLGAVRCKEGEKLASIRRTIRTEAGLSCRCAGAPGVWYKDTILLLDRKTIAPLYIVKAGAGEAVDLLLRNEAKWLKDLGGQAALADHIPELIAHCSGMDLCFVAQSVLSGDRDDRLGEPQFRFLSKLQEYSSQTMLFEDSKLCHTLRSRIKGLEGLLNDAWSARLKKGMERIERTFSGRSVLLVAAHNDFTCWNTRVERGTVRVIDWEFAANEQLPLFDPLHFALMQMALRNEPPVKLIRKMHETLQLCLQRSGKDLCYAAETQALAYLVNLCTLYLCADLETSRSSPTLVCYAEVIDQLCAI